MFVCFRDHVFVVNLTTAVDRFVPQQVNALVHTSEVQVAFESYGRSCVFSDTDVEIYRRVQVHSEGPKQCK